MDTNLSSRVETILSLARKEDWSDESFSLKKSHVCVELSAIVYEEVSEYELKKASRIHLFASDTYRGIVESGTTRSVIDFLQGDAETTFFIVRGEYSVILGSLFRDVLILAIRGTIFCNLWDWKANVDARKYPVYSFDDMIFPTRRYPDYPFDGMFFHSGFYKSIVPEFSSICDSIGANKNGLKIVWTGHSLGAAMAAIGNAVDGGSRLGWPSSKLWPGKSVGAYTFGMPRYCGFGAAHMLPAPHHIYKKRDLVPSLPPLRMGFSDSWSEYEISESKLMDPSSRRDFFGLAGHIPKVWSSLKAHSIEGYAESIAKALNVKRPS